MKKQNKVIFLVLAVLMLVVTVSLVANTFARYANTYTGTATATAAAWSFTAGDLTQTIDLSTTARTANPNLAANKIAPGTSGSFDVTLDGTGTETGIDYTIEITKPATGFTGLTFTVGDGTGTVEGNKTTFAGTIDYNDETKTKTVTVTWDWAIGDDAAATTGINNADAGQSLTVDLYVRGVQNTTAALT